MAQCVSVTQVCVCSAVCSVGKAAFAVDVYSRAEDVTPGKEKKDTSRKENRVKKMEGIFFP